MARAAREQIGTMVACSSGTVHVREDGPEGATPIVLLHGYTSSLHSYDLVTPLLADAHRVVRIDLFGHGCTGPGGLDPETQGDMVAAVLDELGLEGAIVGGHSYGADAALRAAEVSDRVKAVLLIAQAPDYSYAHLPPLARVIVLPGVGSALQRLSSPASVARSGGFAFAPGYKPDRDLGQQIFLDFRAMQPAMHRTVVVDRRAWLNERPLDVRVQQIAKPTLAILGREDQFYDCAKTTARYAAAGAEVVVVEGSGHSPIVERPEETAGIIMAFAQAH